MNDYDTLIKDAVYHAYNRGNDKMMLFHEPVDKTFFLRKLKELQEVYNFKLYSYCIMNNHFHLAIENTNSCMPIVMASLQDYYAIYYNAKYNHSGHVFQGRYKKKLVLGYLSFFTLIRYILRNPLVAGMVSSLEQYPWISLDLNHDTYGLIDFDYINSNYMKYYNTPFDKFLSDITDDSKISNIEVYTIKDSEAPNLLKEIISKVTNGTIQDFNQLSAEQKNKVASRARYLGLSCRQIIDLTNVSRYYLEKIGKPKTEAYI